MIKKMFIAMLILGVSFVHAKSSDSFSKEIILSKMMQVSDWQYANEFRHRKLDKLGDQKYLDWIYGPYVNGLVAAGQSTGENSFIKRAEEIGQRTDWGFIKTGWVANDHATLQSWIELHEMDPSHEKIEKVIQTLNHYMDENVDADLDLQFIRKNKYKWSWCDALYMSPPTFARLAKVTGDKKYSEFLHKWWWAVSFYYYSKEHQLYYRDQTFFTKKAPNGEAIFWCRGNGWVIGGLVRVLQYLEKNDPMRSKYEDELKAMLTKLKDIQCDDGLWHGSLLDPMSPNQPDTSGSGFILYGFAYALNKGLLPKSELLPVIEKAWPSLLSYLNSEGRFCGVQPIGDKPVDFNNQNSTPYGSGAFLLAASEIYKLEQ